MMLLLGVELPLNYLEMEPLPEIESGTLSYKSRVASKVEWRGCGGSN
jgi:hypothetical protein